MATVVSDETTISFPIVKTETTPDGDLLVYGKATDGSVDSDEQIVDPAWSGKALSEWLATGGNVRVQHNPHRDPAGVGVDVEVDKNGAHWVKTLVVEPTAKALVRKGVLRAYSVGIMRPRVVHDNQARGGRIVDGEIGELSLVDRPANRNCGVTLVKSAKDGTAELSGELWGDSSNGVTVSLPADLNLTMTPGDLARIEKHNKERVERTSERTSVSPADMAAQLAKLRADIEKQDKPADPEPVVTAKSGKPFGDNEDTKCASCGKGMSADHAFCPKCGAKAGAAKAAAPELPTAGAAEMPAAPVDKSARLHDLLCAAYDPATATKTHGVELVDAVHTDWSDPGLSDLAAALRGADKTALADARTALHKSFAAAYPTVQLTPGESPAGQYARPVLTVAEKGVSGVAVQAAMAMRTIHDHLAATRPELCPMGHTAPAAAKSETGTGTDADPVAGLIEKVASMEQRLGELLAQPDPNAAPVRGILKNASGGAGPADRRSLVDEATERDGYVRYLEQQAQSGDPQMREPARAALTKMRS